MTTTPTATELAKAVRFLTMDAIENQKFGHPGTAMGAADQATVLFTRFMKFDPSDPEWPDRDRFILSVGHASMLLYSVLYLTGYKAMSLDQLKQFRCLGSITAGHPEYDIDAGIEITTGPLGQGIASGVGMALAERMLNARYGDGIVDHFTYVLTGDGCIMEGVAHEAVSVAGHYGLGRLIVFWDDNKIINDGPATMAATEDYEAVFAAKGWHIQHIDGHDAAAIESAIAAAKAVDDKPSLIRCTTTIGQGAPTKAGAHSTHATPLGAEEVAAARQLHGWPYEPFQVPNEILSAWREPGQRGAEARAEWQKRVDALPPAKKAEFERVMAGRLPDGWEETLRAFKKRMAEERPVDPNIVNSGKVIAALADVMPELAGASADLEKPVACRPESMPYVTPGRFRGPLRSIRNPRTRHGIGGQRRRPAPGPQILCGYLSGVLGLSVAGDSPIGPDAYPGHLRIRRRFHRHRHPMGRPTNRSNSSPGCGPCPTSTSTAPPMPSKPPNAGNWR